ncbi:MAG: bifunctional nuclease family protein [bacterium]
MAESDLHAMHILGVIHGQGTDESILLLEDEEHRHLAIPVGICEAAAVESAINGTKTERPQTHDLLATLMERLGSPVSHVVIDDFSQGVYYARIILQAEDQKISIDSRPSDGVTIALKTQVPLFASEAVIACGL